MFWETVNTLKKASLLLLFNSLLIIITSCDNSSDPAILDETSRGTIVETQFLANYTLEYITAIASFAGDGFQTAPMYGMNVYRLVYYTVDPDENIVTASGAIVIPETQEPLPILSIQHGTISKRTQVASFDPSYSLEGLLAASMGYYVVVADYLGLGVSEIMHPYLHAKSSATCVVDILRAAKAYAMETGIEMNTQIFLAGYSEGGYVTLATQREIENYHSAEFNLTAVSAMAGPYDLELTASHIISREEYPMPGFIAFLLTSYNDVYGWNRINDFFQEPYLTTIPTLLDGTKNMGEINIALTTDMSALLKPEFINSVGDGTERQLLSALAENSLLNFTPVSPLLLIHGNADTYVPYENSTKALNSFRNNGAGSVELITIEGGTHTTSVIPAILASLEWLNNFTDSNNFATRSF